MNKQCLCDSSSEENFDEKNEEYELPKSNRIFLNFSRECKHPAKDKYNQKKVHELFKCLQGRPDLQEMKVFGWSGNVAHKDLFLLFETLCIHIHLPNIYVVSWYFSDENEETVSESESDDGIEAEFKNQNDSSYGESSSQKGGGQRFAMSRDFWYRKLNTLKAQKLDEAAVS